MEHYLRGAARNDEDGASFKMLKSLTASSLDEAEANLSSIGFECNICLDLVKDPVVTLCGHLYCWPCIYRWMSFQPAENLHHQSPQCPVCKTEVSEKTLIPLYGRGHATKDDLSLTIPQRPPSPRCLTNIVLPNRNINPFEQLHRRGYAPLSPRDESSSYTASAAHLADPMIGMFGEMMYARIFGNSTYPNSYHLAGSASPRMRRHVMQADKSLSRLCFFFFCCMVLCLLLF